ncbi:MAG TPA: LpqB family beta-propeller domain-containing protein [Actinomycetes bacterium]|nr:LpqB family beta-propeller domain-containing protein [Actinomycetes bacterium]
MRERLGPVLGLACLALLVTGCVSIPDSGSVTTRTAEAHAQHPQGYIHAFAPLARPGLTAAQVVQGFLLAQVDPDHTAALSYLTDEEASRWNPDARVVVLGNDNPPRVAAAGGGEYRFSAPQAGVISGQGDYTATPRAQAQGSVTVRRVGSEWRISEAPDGLYLSPDDFARNYAVYDTYFIDPASQRLVPNPVYIPVSATASTSLVEALLDGPSAWLSPAVRTAFPPGTRLALPSAPVRLGVVQVDLTTQVLLASPADRRLLGAQLAWTLGQLDGVKGVRVSVGGVPLPELEGQVDRGAYSSLDPAGGTIGPAVAVVSGRVTTLGKSPVPVPGAMGDPSTPLVDPAVSLDGSRVAALNPAATRLFVADARAGSPMRVAISGQSLTAPSFDPSGEVWTAGTTPAGPVVWVVSGDTVRQVETPGLGRRQVRALRIARDGVRVAVVLEHGGRGALYLGRIVRTGTDVRLDGLHRIESSLLDVADVAWAGADSILALSADTLQPYLVQPFGVVVPTGAPLRGATNVTAAPQQPVLASTSNGRIYTTDSTDTWLALRGVRPGTGRDPSYPG